MLGVVGFIDGLGIVFSRPGDRGGVTGRNVTSGGISLTDLTLGIVKIGVTELTMLELVEFVLNRLIVGDGGDDIFQIRSKKVGF